MPSASTELSKSVCPASKRVGIETLRWWLRSPVGIGSPHLVLHASHALCDSCQLSSLLLHRLRCRPAGTTQVPPKFQSLCGLLPSQLPPLSAWPSLSGPVPFEKGHKYYFFLKTSASSLPPMSGLPPVSHWQPYHVGLWFLGSVSAFLTRFWT